MFSLKSLIYQIRLKLEIDRGGEVYMKFFLGENLTIFAEFSVHLIHFYSKHFLHTSLHLNIISYMYVTNIRFSQTIYKCYIT